MLPTSLPTNTSWLSLLSGVSALNDPVNVFSLAGAMAPKSQVGFFDFIIMPLFTSMAKVFPDLQPMVDQAHDNWLFWKNMTTCPQYEIMSLEHYEADMLKHAHPDSLMDMEDPDYARTIRDSGLIPRSLQSSAGEMFPA
jgi:hypothetical protein